MIVFGSISNIAFRFTFLVIVAFVRLNTTLLSISTQPEKVSPTLVTPIGA
jgi:hypothetical protein